MSRKIRKTLDIFIILFLNLFIWHWRQSSIIGLGHY